MRFHDKSSVEMVAGQQQMVEANRYEYANERKEIKPACKKLSFIAGVLKGSLEEVRKRL